MILVGGGDDFSHTLRQYTMSSLFCIGTQLVNKFLLLDKLNENYYLEQNSLHLHDKLSEHKYWAGINWHSSFLKGMFIARTMTLFWSSTTISYHQIYVQIVSSLAPLIGRNLMEISMCIMMSQLGGCQGFIMHTIP